MAQKAAKSRAVRNAQVLTRTHLLAVAVHAIFLLLRCAIFRASLTRSSLVLYVLLSIPALAVQIMFERNSRPRYNSANGDLRNAGEDLDASGLTEWMWDLLYWTWGCTVIAALLGDWVWWFYLAVPLYSAWLAYSTFGNVRQSLTGAAQPMDSANGASSTGTSKRQQKMEKRGNKVQYR